MADIDFFKSYLSKLVEEGVIESDKVEDLSEEELVKIATNFMDMADAAYDEKKENYGN